MSRKSIILLLLLILAPVVIYFLWPSDESRIRKLFKEGAQAIEQKKIEDVMARVSFNYSDEYGLTYRYIKEGMTRVFRRMDGIKIEYEITGIAIKDTDATAELDIRVIASQGTDTGYVVGDAAKPAHLKFTLDKERTSWLVIRTEGLPLNF
ncbi:MAG TPA: hypothetical protein VEP69_02820 [Thermodesulfovibrionales bacterium]|nr:hypothetical protein [Thermodesulfovibrionales bacterium]